MIRRYNTHDGVHEEGAANSPTGRKRIPFLRGYRHKRLCCSVTLIVLALLVSISYLIDQVTELKTVAETEQRKVMQVQAEFERLKAKRADNIRMHVQAEFETLKKEGAVGVGGLDSNTMVNEESLLLNMNKNGLPRGAYQKSCHACGFRDIISGEPTRHLQCLCKSERTVWQASRQRDVPTFTATKLTGLLPRDIAHCADIVNSNGELRCPYVRMPWLYTGKSCSECVLISNELSCRSFIIHICLKHSLMPSQLSHLNIW